MQTARHMGGAPGHLQQVAREHQDKLQLAAKLGWLAKGALYITLGALAVVAAFGQGGAVEDGKGVLSWVASQPFGTFLLAAAGVGFICYALWRVVQVIFDPERHHSNKEMIAKRLGWAASAVTHGALAVAAFQLIVGEQGQSQKMWLSEVLRHDWGPWLVGALGAFVIGVGFYQFKKAKDLAFMDDVNTRQMSHKETNVFRLVGRFGFAARGVVFPIIGYFLIEAAVTASPSQAKDVGGALMEIGEAGMIPLAIVALGLAAYGVAQLFFAKYRRVNVS